MARPKARPDAGRVVYPSALGRLGGSCGKPVAQCRCRRDAAAERPEGDGVVRVRRETKGRGGKTVTTVTGVPGDAEALTAVAKQLKKRCGVGGSVKDWVIVIQGDVVDIVVAELEKAGHRVKRAGG